MELLAHQGGWDEILFVATPVAVFAGLLWLARTRADREHDGDHDEEKVGEEMLGEEPARPDER